jgi:hypothetical protein
MARCDGEDNPEKDKAGDDKKANEKSWCWIGGVIIFLAGLIFAIMSLMGTIVRLGWYLPLTTIHMRSPTYPYCLVITWSISAILIITGYLLIKSIKPLNFCSK